MDPATLIRRARRAQGLTQAQLAFRAGTSQQTISRLEAGREDPTWGRMGSLLLALGLRPGLTAEALGHQLDPRDLAYARSLSIDDRLDGGANVLDAVQDLQSSRRRA